MVKHGKFLFDSQSNLTAYGAHLLFISSAVHRGIQELTWWFSLGKALNYTFYAHAMLSHLWGKKTLLKKMFLWPDVNKLFVALLLLSLQESIEHHVLKDHVGTSKMWGGHVFI